MSADQQAMKPEEAQGGIIDATSLTDADLLAQLLYPEQPPRVKKHRAETLLSTFGGLRGQVIASRLDTGARAGLSDADALHICLAHEVVKRQLKQSLQRGVALTSPAMTAACTAAPVATWSPSPSLPDTG